MRACRGHERHEEGVLREGALGDGLSRRREGAVAFRFEAPPCRTAALPPCRPPTHHPRAKPAHQSHAACAHRASRAGPPPPPGTSLPGRAQAPSSQTAGGRSRWSTHRRMTRTIHLWGCMPGNASGRAAMGSGWWGGGGKGGWGGLAAARLASTARDARRRLVVRPDVTLTYIPSGLLGKPSAAPPSGDRC